MKRDTVINVLLIIAGIVLAIALFGAGVLWKSKAARSPRSFSPSHFVFRSENWIGYYAVNTRHESRRAEQDNEERHRPGVLCREPTYSLGRDRTCSAGINGVHIDARFVAQFRAAKYNILADPGGSERNFGRWNHA
jgi:hypothetical protein